ncbi:hypothetical protein BV25DRAFT_1822292 [Artomyces pyxidatus]|uniref:Uncharacterized protein n=1 Tax=Artomyces pyxidatus TaxID=48021 RepID=A0ACB8TAG6_9AGAM|nr:hypothetical protein BV25DRAFT_1822292 [Artomyces pyxidatus]
MRGPGLVPSLPPELLSHIASYLQWPEDFPAFLLVNSHFHAIATRTLYHTVYVNSARAVRLLRSIDVPGDRRHNLITSLTLNFTKNRVLKQLDLLVQRVLPHLKKLKALTFEVSSYDSAWRGQAWVFPLDAPFHLRSLTTSARFSTHLSAFLESQPEILDLSLRGFATEPFNLDQAALPHLRSFRSVHSSPQVLAQIVTARPLKSVSITLIAEDAVNALGSLALSSTPIKRLTILIIDASAPATELFPQLAATLPQLEALHIVALVQTYDLDIMHAATPLLAAFPGLRYLTFMASGDPAYDLGDEAGVATDWATACPSLRTIILPKGKMWFRKEGIWAVS